MAIAFSAITGIKELRAPANPSAAKGNVAFSRSVEVIVPASTTVAALPIGLMLDPGTVVLGAILDTDTTFGATSTLALSTSTSIFVAAATLTVTGGVQATIAANKGVVVASSATAALEVSLTLAAATSPASEVTVRVTLICANIGPVESRSTYST